MKTVHFRVQRYLISLLFTLMAPAMVFSMGLEANGLELFNKESKEKDTKAVIAQQEEEKKKAYYPLDCFSSDVFRLMTEFIPLEDKIPQRLFPLPGTKFYVLFPDRQSYTGTEFNCKTKCISEYSEYVVGKQKILHIYDATGNVLQMLEHENTIKFAKFSEDGTRILTISMLDLHDTVHVWDVETGKQLYSFSNNTLTKANFNPTNNNQIVISCSDDVIRICDVTRQQIIGTLEHNLKYNIGILSVAFHPHGNYIATSTWNHTLILWDINTKTVIHTFKSGAAHYSVNIVAFSADGSRLIAATYDSIASAHGSIHVWNTTTFALEYSMELNREIYSMALNANGSLALVGLDHGTAWVLDLNSKTNKIIYELHYPDVHNKNYKKINSVSFDGDDRVITSDFEGLIIAWDLKPFKKLAQGKITQEQYKLLNLLAQHDTYCTNTLMPRIQRTIDCYKIFDRRSFSLSIKNQLAALKIRWNAEIDSIRCYALYPLDLSILARKHNIPVKELRKALDSFDPEVKQYIIKKYNIKTDWFYWCTRPAVLYSAASGAVVAGLGTYLGWKLFKR